MQDKSFFISNLQNKRFQTPSHFHNPVTGLWRYSLKPIRGVELSRIAISRSLFHEEDEKSFRENLLGDLKGKTVGHTVVEILLQVFRQHSHITEIFMKR